MPGAFVADPDFKPKKIKDFDIATLYPTKKDPANFNPTELLRKLALDVANQDIYRKQLEWFENANKESVKRVIEKKKDSTETFPDFDKMTDEQIVDNYEEILKYYIIKFNKNDLIELDWLGI